MPATYTKVINTFCNPSNSFIIICVHFCSAHDQELWNKHPGPAWRVHCISSLEDSPME